MSNVTLEKVETIGPDIAQFFGRKPLYADYDEDYVNIGTREELETRIADILNQVWFYHNTNAGEIDYLESYYRGYQPILGKHKDVRPSINNVVLENNAYFVTNFKVGYVFGEPIQFTQRGEKANPEISILNSYALAEDKYAKDTELAESLYNTGIAHRMVLPDIDEDSPFMIENLDSKTTFLVYSSNVGHKKLLGVTFTRGVRDTTVRGSIYTKTGFYTFTKGLVDNAFYVKYEKPHYLGTIPIFEYSLNKWRMGIVEVVMSIFNALNRISSGDVDGLEQYIQSILVFVNNEVDKETYQDILDLGAVELSTADPSRPADIKLLQSELDHNNTQTLHERLFNLALTIIGIPRMSDSTSSGGDTGQAKRLSDGWTMAEERAKQDEMSFKRCSKEEIRLILKICRLTPNSGITKLTLKDVDQKLPRNSNDNFLVKAQGMMNLISSGVAPDIAFSSSGVFSDSNEAYNKTMEFYGGLENWIKYFITKTKSDEEKSAIEAGTKVEEKPEVDEFGNKVKENTEETKQEKD